MVRRYYELPSLTSLAAFEACARHLSFKLAAAELNVTSGAVSRQIKALEEELGVHVFARAANGVTLTDNGTELYAILATSFSRTADTIRRIKNDDRVKNVTIACTDAFAQMWLIPRMPHFWEKFPDVTVDHLISDDLRDFRRAEIDLRIRYGLGSWPDEQAEKLLDETIYPVCGPKFAEDYAGTLAQSLPDLPLLHVDWVNPNWADWPEVLRRAGISHGPLKGRRFGRTYITLQVAQANQGVAVGWHQLVHPMIERGTLVRFTDLVIPTSGGYYLTWNDNRTLSPAAEVLKNWLVEAAHQCQ
jgi:LysR family glycine cleavage system transcriptional activator